jgi:hypothetical protein
MGQRPEQLPARLKRLVELLAEQGRARSTVQVAVAPYFTAVSRSVAEDFAATGIDELIIMYASESVKETLNMLDSHAQLVELTREDERGSPRK